MDTSLGIVIDISFNIGSISCTLYSFNSSNRTNNCNDGYLRECKPTLPENLFSL